MGAEVPRVQLYERSSAKRRIAPKAVFRFKLESEPSLVEPEASALRRMVREVGRYLQGWQSYFGFCQTPTVLTVSTSGSGVACALLPVNNGGQGRTRFARLRQLGLSHDLAARTAGQSHGDRGGLAERRPSLMPCPPLTSIAWDFLLALHVGA